MTIEQHKQKLLALEQELLQRIRREVDTVRETDIDQADAGDRSIAHELRDTSVIQAQTDATMLEQVQAALKRIEDGTFGKCAVDGGPIEEKRLEAVPWTRYCLKHQRRAEESAGLRMPTL